MRVRLAHRDDLRSTPRLEEWFLIESLAGEFPIACPERPLSASDAAVNPAGSEIGLEAHPETDQCLRLDAGSGRVQMGSAKDKFTFGRDVSDGGCVVVPAGNWHDITDVGATLMQVNPIYAPAHHTPGNVQATAAVADTDKEDEPADWSVKPKLNAAVAEHGGHEHACHGRFDFTGAEQ